MPAASAVLLPLCLGLTLIGVLAVVLTWRRGRRGRAVQLLGVALAPLALYAIGALALLWDGVAALVGWASRLVLSPVVWFGLVLLALCFVFFVVGGFLARRSAARKPSPAAPSELTSGGRKRQPPATATGEPIDEDLAEIEAILAKRGIS